MKKTKTYYAVFDQNDDVWGSGTTKTEARKEANYWNKENGPASLPFKPAIPCSEKLAASGTGEPWVMVDGVAYLTSEVRQRKA